MEPACMQFSIEDKNHIKFEVRCSTRDVCRRFLIFFLIFILIFKRQE